MERFDELVAELQALAPNDVVMPVEVGQKRPLFPHSESRWSWRKLNEFRSKIQKQQYDACVILRDLCVVDVDTMETAAALEAEFPALLHAPAETTRRGMHYWFKRSRLADELGYFNGSSQRLPGVDFLTRTSTGSGGVVVVAPSSSRRFARRLSPETLVEIPSDLLDRVAAPRHPKLTAKFEFEGSLAPELLTVHKECANLSYLDPFFDGSILMAEDGGIPVPCTRDEFMLAIDLCARRDEAMFPAADALRGMLTLERLGGPACHTHVESGRVLWSADLERAWPAMWHAMREPAVVDLPFGSLTYEHIGRLQHCTTLMLDPFRTRPGPAAQVLRHEAPPPSAIPDVVLDLMRRHRLVLAGGATLGIVTNECVAAGHDWDLFVYGSDEEAADAMLADVTATLAGWKRFRTGRAWTFYEPDERERGPSCFSPGWRGIEASRDRTVVQIVLTLFDHPEQVIQGFDLVPSQVAAWIDPSTGELVFKVTAACLESLRRLAMPVSISSWGTSTVARVVKYARKGFDVVAPAVRRPILSYARQSGISGLFAIETAIRNWNRDRERVFGYPSESKFNLLVKQVLSKINADRQSGYGVQEIKAFGMFKYLLRRMFHTDNGALRPWELTLWRRRCAADAAAQNQMQPSDAGFEALHDAAAFMAVACRDLGVERCLVDAKVERMAIADVDGGAFIERELFARYDRRCHGQLLEKFVRPALLRGVGNPSEDTEVYEVIRLMRWIGPELWSRIATTPGRISAAVELFRAVAKGDRGRNDARKCALRCSWEFCRPVSVRAMDRAVSLAQRGDLVDATRMVVWLLC